MVVKMMRWPPWPPLVTRKYEVKLIVRRLEGFDSKKDGSPEKDALEGGGAFVGCDPLPNEFAKGLTVEIRWKGPKATALMSSLRRIAVKRQFTKEVPENDGVFAWEEEFQNVCNLSAFNRDSSQFHPWEIGFTVFNESRQGAKNKIQLIGTASLNLAEFAIKSTQKEFDLTVPLTVSGTVLEPCPLLCISISLVELRTAQEPGDSLHKSVVPTTTSEHSHEVPPPPEKDELSALKAGLRKVKILTGYMSSRRVKKVFRGREEDGSVEGKDEFSRIEDDGDCPFNSDSCDEFKEEETDKGAKLESLSSVRKSFSYGSLAYANYAGGSFFSSSRVDGSKVDEDWIYYSHRKSDVGYSVNEDRNAVSEPPMMQGSKRSISLLPWKKRKLSFRSPKAKGEPLLKKDYAEEGGDDIDYDRRQLTTDELNFGWQKSDKDSTANQSSVSEFGDDCFAVGSWEYRDITSRDGHLKLQTQVFFASIDQRSEKAAGESACSVLVALIADWLQNNPENMPIKSQLDTLIRDGSLEWRNLCEDYQYKERFSDKHFDLDTILQAKIRPLSVHPERSFIGFFHPTEGTMDEGRFDFLQGAMSLDNIWEEISRAASPCNNNANNSQVYVVSWNDHFFVLKAEPEAYYIIDTLGERLYEGCNQAYILKFDQNTKIVKLPPDPTQSDGEGGLSGADQACTTGQACTMAAQDFKSGPQHIKDGSSVGMFPVETTNTEELAKSGWEEELVYCQGKEACKEYIKCFLAAIPVRELLADLSKGLVSSTPIHQRLQIEFHYTQSMIPLLPPLGQALSAAEAVTSPPCVLGDISLTTELADVEIT